MRGKSLKPGIWHPSIYSAPIVSVVAMAELSLFAARREWGSKRLDWLEDLYRRTNVIPIAPGPLTEEFIRLHYEQEKKGLKLGKHDTWIAATAKIYDATLVTLDSDFSNLPTNYVAINWIDHKTGQPKPAP